MMNLILLSLFAPVAIPFYLLTTTMNVDSGIARTLPPIPKEELRDEDPKINAKNIYVVLINTNSQLLVEGELMDISQLKDGAKKFIDNNGKDPNSSDNPQKAIISLKSKRGTSYKMYIRVQNELTAAYTELRNEKSNLDYGKDFNKLNGDEYKTIKNYYPMKISEADIKGN